MHKSGFARCALTLLFAGWAPASWAAENLQCITQGYEPEQMQRIERYQLALNPSMPPPEEGQADLFEIVNNRAVHCAEQHDWSPDAIEDAVFFQITSVMRGGLIRNTPFTAAQMRRLDQAIAAADQQRLRSIVSRSFDTALAGEADPELSEPDRMFLGRLILRAGLPFSQQNGEFAGAYLGATVASQMYSERFAGR